MSAEAAPLEIKIAMKNEELLALIGRQQEETEFYTPNAARATAGAITNMWSSSAR